MSKNKLTTWLVFLPSYFHHFLMALLAKVFCILIACLLVNFVWNHTVYLNEKQIKNTKFGYKKKSNLELTIDNNIRLLKKNLLSAYMHAVNIFYTDIAYEFWWESIAFFVVYYNTSKISSIVWRNSCKNGLNAP